MAKIKRNKLQRLDDLKYIKKLYLKGNISPTQITEKVNDRYAKKGIDIELSVPQIHYDIESMINEIQKEIPAEATKIIAIQEQRILNVMKEAYLAWSQSKGIDEETIVKSGTNEKGPFENKTLKKRKLKGDPRYLIVIDNCIDKISRLHKLYDKEKDGGDNDKGLLPELLEMLKGTKDK